MNTAESAPIEWIDPYRTVFSPGFPPAEAAVAAEALAAGALAAAGFPETLAALADPPALPGGTAAPQPARTSATKAVSP